MTNQQKGAMTIEKFRNLETEKPEYWRGIVAAYDEYASGHITDIPLARRMFRIDPPDNDFQRGYLRAVIEMDSANE
jgi:hypothetical protein